MRVVLDARCLTHPLTGIGRSVLMTLQALLRLDAETRYLLFTDSSDRPLEDPRITWFGARRYGFVRSPELDLMANRVLFRDVVMAHFPNYEMEPSVRMRRNAVTVYDLFAEVRPDLCPPDQLERVRQKGRAAATACDAVIVPSESTARDVVQYWQIPRDRLHVVPLAPVLTQPGNVVLDLPRPYVLAVGTLEPRKNLVRLLRAMVALRRRHAVAHRLVLVGRRGWMVDDLLHLIEAHRDDVVWLDYLPDDKLAAAFAGADLLACPSLYEGFGLSVAEAMALGVPVLTSPVSSLLEVGGAAVAYADPQSEEELEARLLALLQHSEERAALAAKGREQAARFTWDATARLTRTLYQRLSV